jgi:hypothetical protein
MQLDFGQFKLRLLGTILKDQGETLLVRPQCGSDLEVATTKVLAIEECECPCPRAHIIPQYVRFEEALPLPQRPSESACLTARMKLRTVSRTMPGYRSALLKHAGAH